MEQVFREVIMNNEIERVLEAFVDAIECVPRGICLPDEAEIVVSKYYVAFIAQDGEVRLVRDGQSLFVEVRANGWRLVTDRWDMFVLKHRNKLAAYSPRVAVGKDKYTTDELIGFVRRGFQNILSAPNWV